MVIVIIPILVSIIYVLQRLEIWGVSTILIEWISNISMQLLSLSLFIKSNHLHASHKTVLLISFDFQLNLDFDYVSMSSFPKPRQSHSILEKLNAFRFFGTMFRLELWSNQSIWIIKRGRERERANEKAENRAKRGKERMKSLIRITKKSIKIKKYTQKQKAACLIFMINKCGIWTWMYPRWM